MCTFTCHLGPTIRECSLAIRRAVVYYAQAGEAAHAFSAGIKCQHCRCVLSPVTWDPVSEDVATLFYVAQAYDNKSLYKTSLNYSALIRRSVRSVYDPGCVYR